MVFEFERALLMGISPLLFFGGLFAIVILQMDFWFGALPMFMGIVDVIVVKVLFPIESKKKVVVNGYRNRC